MSGDYINMSKKLRTLYGDTLITNLCCSIQIVCDTGLGHNL